MGQHARAVRAIPVICYSFYPPRSDAFFSNYFEEDLFVVRPMYDVQTFIPVTFLADRTISRAFGRPTVCRLSSVTFCIVAKRYVLAKDCLKERKGNQGQKVDFLGRRHISTSGFASIRPQRRPSLPYFCPYSPAIGTR